MQEQGILDREDFFLDPSLVLYLPLHQLDGSSFMSRDAYGHLCTVTGALWTPDGRLFDELDDRITVGSVGDSELAGLGDTTVLVWAYPTSLALESKSIIAKNNRSAEDRYNLYISASGQATFFYENNNTQAGVIGTDGAITVDEWYFFSARFGSGGVKFETDLGDQGVNLNTNPMRSEDGTALPLYIGRDYNNDFEFAGTIGAAWIYSRYLTDGEISRTKNSTSWRYQ